MSKIIAFLTDCSGATSIEYALLASGIAVVIVGTVNSLGGSVKSKYMSIGDALK